jgi:hypothetical protein
MIESRGIAMPKSMTRTLQAQLLDYRRQMPFDEVVRLKSLTSRRYEERLLEIAPLNERTQLLGKMR